MKVEKMGGNKHCCKTPYQNIWVNVIKIEAEFGKFDAFCICFKLNFISIHYVVQTNSFHGQNIQNEYKNTILTIPYFIRLYKNCNALLHTPIGSWKQ